MCTAVAFNENGLYFGRNMDLEYDFGAKLVRVPREFLLSFKDIGSLEKHYAFMGIAAVVQDYPLFCDGVNEHGLCVAGLNFNGFATCRPKEDSKTNLTPYEVISYILATCKNVSEAKKALERTNLVDIPFMEGLPVPTLHWIISDDNASIVFEFTKDGGKIFDNTVGVMTNNPSFDYHLYNLSFYKNLQTSNPNKAFKENKNMGVGEGSLGLPGDYSSASRFVRACFVKENSPINKSEKFCPVAQTFHILESVQMPRGAVTTEQGIYDITMYSACIDAKNKIYYFKTYDNVNVKAVKLNLENMDNDKISSITLEQKINYEFLN